MLTMQGDYFVLEWGSLEKVHTIPAHFENGKKLLRIGPRAYEKRHTFAGRIWKQQDLETEHQPVWFENCVVWTLENDENRTFSTFQKRGWLILQAHNNEVDVQILRCRDFKATHIFGLVWTLAKDFS